MKRLKTFIISVMVCLSIFVPVKAETENSAITNNFSENEVILRFEDFYYTFNVNEEVTTQYEKTEELELYKIFNQYGDLIDEVSVKYSTPKQRIHPDAHLATFSRKHVYRGDTIQVCAVRVDVVVMYYAAGSFRSFEDIEGANLLIDTCETPMELTDSYAYAKPKGGKFPATELEYTSGGTLRCTDTIDIAIGELISAGFSKDTHYYKYINASGKISLY